MQEDIIERRDDAEGLIKGGICNIIFLIVSLCLNITCAMCVFSCVPSYLPYA